MHWYQPVKSDQKETAIGEDTTFISCCQSQISVGERGNINVVAFIFHLNNETKVMSINAKKKKGRRPILVLLTKQASEINEFKFAPNVFPTKFGEDGRTLKFYEISAVHQGATPGSPCQGLFKHSKVSHVEQSITTAVEVAEVWNENSLYEMTPELSKVASILAVITAISCSA